VYRDWARNSGRLLWITGDPGKGKTMLSLYLIRHHEKDMDEPSREKKKLLYFFCSSEEGRNTGVAILRGMIFQLLRDTEWMFRHIQEAFSHHGRTLFQDERFEALWRVFEAMVRDPQLETVTCIFDDLDECLGDLGIVLGQDAGALSGGYSRRKKSVTQPLETHCHQQKLSGVF
jgi:hypothetical protein